MTQLSTVDAARNESAGYKVDVSRGERIGRVSSEWFSRPADERYLSLSELLRRRTRPRRAKPDPNSRDRGDRVVASRDNAERLALMLPGEDVPLAPTHWSFGQLTTMVGAPSTYFRQLPAPLAAINLQYGLTSHRAELIKTLEVEDGRVELRAVTGPDYGRILTMNWSPPCSGSQATAPAIRDGKFQACSTGRPASTTRYRRHRRARPRCTRLIVTSSVPGR